MTGRVDMFDLKVPCSNCPFRKGHGHMFRLREDRLRDILSAPAFTCHKTVDYSAIAEVVDEAERERVYKASGPRQCAGLMGTLHNSGRDNEIMRAARVLIGFDPGTLALDQCYPSVEAAVLAHVDGEEP